MTMAQATTEKSSYRAAFETMQAADARTLPAWVLRLREAALERFEQIGFPTTDAEDWKYTNVAPVTRSAFAPVAAGSPRSELSEDVLAAYSAPEAGSRLVFVNGVYRAEYSSTGNLPVGAVVADLTTAFAGEHEFLMRSHFARPCETEIDGFCALNSAFLSQGALIYLPTGAQVGEPIQLLFLALDAPQPTAIFPRVLVVAERESAATIIESYVSPDESLSFTNAVVEIFVGDNARVTHYKVQRESERAFHIATTNAELGRSSVYDLTTITLGAQLSRHGLHIKLAHEGAECWADGLYLVGTGQHADTHSLIDHSSPHCTSHQLYKGILDGKSRAVFNGKVFVHRDAQKTDAMQSNKNLLLSNEARVDTKPQLEIYADDVKCAHGATVGQLEEEELFYLTSRGLHPDLARNLLTYGFAEELVEKIKIASIKRQLDEAILHRLHARLEV
jgi:Fe-S cluster assembly protein SufD